MLRETPGHGLHCIRATRSEWPGFNSNHDIYTRYFSAMYPGLLILMPLTACFIEVCPRTTMVLLVLETLGALYGVCTL